MSAFIMSAYNMQCRDMTILTSSEDNYYLFGNIQFNLVDYFNEGTLVSTVPIGQLILQEASMAPVPMSETLAVLYKCVPFLEIGTVYDNTHVSAGFLQLFF